MKGVIPLGTQKDDSPVHVPSRPVDPVSTETTSTDTPAGAWEGSESYFGWTNYAECFGVSGPRARSRGPIEGRWTEGGI